MKMKNILSAIAVTGMLSASALTMVYADTSYKYGDANQDGTVNVMDVTAVQKYLVGTQDLSADGLICADVDQSGDVNINDATAIQLYLVGLYELPYDDVIHLPFVPAK